MANVVAVTVVANETEKVCAHQKRGYKRLFINLGKDDGFYPGEVMQFINKNVHGRQAVGHIDLLSKFSYIEVPEKDANKVMKALNGTTYKKREVRCNDAEESGHGRNGRGNWSSKKVGETTKILISIVLMAVVKEIKNKPKSKAQTQLETNETGDWRKFFQHDVKLKGEVPDFSEEGWARRKPKKNK